MKKKNTFNIIVLKLALLLSTVINLGCLEINKPKKTRAIDTSAGFSGVKTQGEWESSGGDGVLCHKDQTSERLYTLENYETLFGDEDIWWSEHPNHKISNWKNLENSNLERDEIIQLVLERLEKYTPVLKQKIDLSLESISLDKWYDQDGEIKEIFDSNPVVEISKNCELVQLAVRESISAPNYLPQVRVFFDKSNFEKLSNLDQAYLVLHEALYLIGKEKGHESSDRIRLLNRFLFSDQFDMIFTQRVYLSKQSSTLRAFFSHYVLDYADLFINEEIYANVGQYKDINYQNNFTRNHAIFEIQKEIRQFVDKCLGEASGGLNTKSCMDELMLSKENLSFIDTDEKAFMFLLNFFFDSYGLILGGSEHLYVLDKDEPLAHDVTIQDTLGATCGHIEAYADREFLEGRGLPRIEGLFAPNVFIKHDLENIDHPWFSLFLYPSLVYCRDIRKKLRENSY